MAVCFKGVPGGTDLGGIVIDWLAETAVLGGDRRSLGVTAALLRDVRIDVLGGKPKDVSSHAGVKERSDEGLN
jgi:hypothetical protein